MKAIKFLNVLLCVAMAGEAAIEHKQHLIDPLGRSREMCRKKCDLTKEQLRMGNKNLQSVRAHLVCLATDVGSLNRDGSINKEMHLKNTALVNPLTIAEPIMNCCLDRVYKGKKPSPHEVAPLLADFVTCWKDLLPNSIWNIIGILEPPVYPRLDKCVKC